MDVVVRGASRQPKKLVDARTVIARRAARDGTSMAKGRNQIDREICSRDLSLVLRSGERWVRISMADYQTHIHLAPDGSWSITSRAQGLVHSFFLDITSRLIPPRFYTDLKTGRCIDRGPPEPIIAAFLAEELGDELQTPVPTTDPAAAEPAAPERLPDARLHIAVGHPTRGAKKRDKYVGFLRKRQEARSEDHEAGFDDHKESPSELCRAFKKMYPKEDVDPKRDRTTMRRARNTVYK
jgi:hypothetical protein